MEKMYPPVVNSPKTELTELITDTQTEITVANAAVLLQGEGIAVLGNGDAAETITYTSVEDNVLKGCVRGFEGVARAWPAGTRIARNFTAADWRAAINNIQALHEEASSESRKPITLQPGVQIVKTDKQAVFNLAGLTGKTVIDYDGQKGVFGVRNPYVIRYGENLLPSFYEWSNKEGTPIITEAYSIVVSSVNKIIQAIVPVVPGQTYTLSVQSGSAIGRIFVYNSQGAAALADKSGSGLITATFTIPTGVKFVEVRLLGTDSSDVTLSNSMLNIGNTAKPFKPREDSMLALQTDLYADPVTGANADTVFERDGQYFKSKKWQGQALDGSLSWSYTATSVGYKRVVLSGVDNVAEGTYNNGRMTDMGRIVKYDGKLLVGDIAVSGGDSYVFEDQGNPTKRLYITIPVADSGWADGYQPNQDDIKAYFFGYKAYDANTITPANAQSMTTATWSGTGTKYWVQRVGAPNFTQSTPPQSYAGYTPYQLVYQLATPTVEPIVSEGQLTFTEGDNQVEVGTGLVLREKAKLYQEADTKRWNINNGSPGQYQASLLNYKVDRFIGIYRNSQRDNWTLYPNNTTPAGALAQLPDTAYDANAAYTVSYLAFITSPVVPFTGSYAANEKTLLLDLVDNVQQNTSRVSVLENKKAEKDSPAWISPSILFNGWVSMGALGYRKIDTTVQLKARIKSGAIGQPFMTLPEGYRPLAGQIRPVHSYGTSDVFASVLINADGKLIVSGGSNNEVNIYLEFTTD
ncbi:hypothetical protein ACU1JV_15330 [Paenibacillus sp. T2-29]|uniref:hypothetical protein n=1 Tax=Paenibacillus TaxID=44249 RepID=UPI0039BC93EB